MKNVKALTALAVFFFVAAGVLATGYFIKAPTNVRQEAAAATNLSIAPVKQTLGTGQDFTFSVNMDTGNNKVTGIDLILNFDPQVLQISSIQRGSGITALNNTLRQNFDNTGGTISFATFTLDKSLAVNGSGVEVLNIKAKTTPGANFGNSLITFDPSTAISATSESQNVLAGGIPGTITIANVTSSPTPTATPTPHITPTPTPAPGQPNSCGGTCGSNLNCASNLYCYQGYCRNPSCGWSTDCSCNSTDTPTPAPTSAPTATPKATSKGSRTVAPTATPSPIVVVMTPTPTPNNFWQNVFNSQSPTPVPSPTLEPVAETVTPAKTFDLLPWIIGSLVVAGLAVIMIVVGILKESGFHRNKPPVIKV